MIAGSALAAPPVDGIVEPGCYGNILFVQNQPTSFGDNVPSDPCDPNDLGDPSAVVTGMEIAIPLADLGNPDMSAGVKVIVFVNGQFHDFVSNQMIGGLPALSDNQGEPRFIDLSTLAGDQFATATGGGNGCPADLTGSADPNNPNFGVPDGIVDANDFFFYLGLFGAGDLAADLTGSIDPNSPNFGVPDGTIDATDFFFYLGLFAGPCNPGGGGTPVIDGTLDAGLYTLATNGLQTNQTGFGNASDGNVDFTNGSELNGLYATSDGTNLYLFITGNLESNFNKLDVFIDSIPGGQNVLPQTGNSTIDFGALQRMGELVGGDGSNGPDGPGLTFDAGFEADFYFTMTNGNIAVDPDPADHEIFANAADLQTGVGAELGSTEAASDGTFIGGDGGFPGIRATLNNANTAGVPGTCPPPAGNRDVANGSEIDGLYATIDPTENKLYLVVTGNLQTNWNKLSLFFDVIPSAGQNPLLPNNVNVDFGGLIRMGGDGIDPGLTFDTGFEPDYFLSVTNGNSPVLVFSNASLLRTNGARVTGANGALDYECFSGGDKTVNDPIFFDGPLFDGTDGTAARLGSNYPPRASADALDAAINGGDPTNPIPPALLDLIQVAIDNSNVAGVTDTSVADAANVITGIEICIDLDELGWDGVTPVRMAGFISNGGYDFISNQVIGGLPDPANLGEVRQIDFSQIAGDQFITIPVGAGCP